MRDATCKNYCLCYNCKDKLCRKYKCQDCLRFGKDEWHVTDCMWTGEVLKPILTHKKDV